MRRCARLSSIRPGSPTNTGPLQVRDVPIPEPAPGELLLKVHACGVCRTDLHITRGELPPLLQRLIPGHQIVGEIAGGATPPTALGHAGGRLLDWRRGRHLPLIAGVAWKISAMRPLFTGYSVNGGYAEYAVVRADLYSRSCRSG